MANVVKKICFYNKMLLKAFFKGIMVILIDGYNLLRQIFPKAKGQLDRQRNQLAKELGFYKKKKKENINEIILVFDSGPFNRALREIKHGIVVMFSGQKSSADEWIAHYTQSHKNQEIVLVTLDRELINICKSPHVEQMDVYKFYKILQDNLYQELEESIPRSSPAQKFEDNYASPHLENLEVDSEALDLLMEEAHILHIDKKEDEPEEPMKRKGTANKLSKKKKKIYATLKKLK